jgi:NitT/TauT family transport system permease protein
VGAVGVWIGMNPRWSGRLQAVAQFLAAFPANLLFPIVVVLIVRWHLTRHLAVAADGVRHAVVHPLQRDRRGLERARRAALRGAEPGPRRLARSGSATCCPPVFPSFVTGAITGSGGSWNASIVSEYVSWGDTTLQAQGLGSYIAHMTASATSRASRWASA